ncbi:MAG: alpha/beta hydrolase [Trichodesmium sp. ALOHA_ZT_67]|nr:alpha/beta hydrolase [Trichodesmium sp. ALOHA_ZT_67]
MLYNFRLRTVIRELLNKDLPEEEFNDLVYDYFPDVYNQFTNGQNKKQRVRILIEYADKHREIEQLLEGIKNINPKVYQEYESKLGENPPPPPIEKCDVLVLAANPTTTQPLQLKKETELIREKLQQTEFGKNYIVYGEENAFIEDLSKYLLKYEPRILHFSGHGNSQGEIILNNRQGEAEVLPLETLSELLSIVRKDGKPIECVVFNACFSLKKADAVAHQVGCVIGMKKEIGDDSALIFAEEFYQGLAYQRSYYQAFQLGINGIERLRLPDSPIPHFIPFDTSLLESETVSLRSHQTNGYLTSKEAVRKKAKKKKETVKVKRSLNLKDTKETTATIYPLWFGTNRKPVDTDNISKGFSGKRDDKLHYGICQVAVPKSHKIGSIGSPLWKRLITFTDDRLKLHFQSLKILEKEPFWENINEELKDHEINERSALVFVHGYNVNFEDAAIRAAQMGFDLQVPGITAFYSWPSQGKLSAYPVDEASIEASEKYMTEFLLNLAEKTDIEKIHIIAHSMGNRGLLRAVQRIISQVQTITNIAFGQIILAAPDVDIDLFKELAKGYRQLAERTTLYISSKDKALATSALIHQHGRAGFFPPVTVVEGIDTVKVSKIDLTLLGHGYFADARLVLEDIRDLLINNTSPGQRRGRLEPSEEGGYWIMRQ